MQKPKEGVISSFIKCLKSFIFGTKEIIEPVLKKEIERLPRGTSKRVTTTNALDLNRGEIVRALDNGETKASIAKKYNTSAVNLHYWLQRRKIRLKKKQS